MEKVLVMVLLWGGVHESISEGLEADVEVVAEERRLYQRAHHDGLPILFAGSHARPPARSLLWAYANVLLLVGSYFLTGPAGLLPFVWCQSHAALEQIVLGSGRLEFVLVAHARTVPRVL